MTFVLQVMLQPLYIQVISCHQVIFYHTLAVCMFVLIIPQGGRTPLMTASFEGHVDIVRALIEARAQVNTRKEVWLLLPPETHCTTHHHTQCYYI